MLSKCPTGEKRRAETGSASPDRLIVPLPLSGARTLREPTVDPLAELARLREQLDAAQQEIRLLNEKLTAALDGTGLCIWQGEPQSGRLTVFNLQDFDVGEMAPSFAEFVAKLHPLDREATLASYFAHLEGRSEFYEAEYRTVGQDGSITWLWDRGRVVERDAAGQPRRILGAHVDVSRRKEFELKLARLAHIDPLTGLANRRKLSAQLRQETERAKRNDSRFSLAILDVDHFKRFNDVHGHEVGDRVLGELARTLQGGLREYDLCGRWGGEEFLLLLPDTALAEALAVVDRVHADIRQCRVVQDGLALSITASIGLAEYQASENYSDTLRRADSALLEAKRRGRDCILSA